MSGLAGAAAFRNVLYNTFVRRNSMYVLTIIGAGYFGTRYFDNLFDRIWASHNKGKLWSDVVLTLPPKEEDDDE